jgi:hypothetical protein
MSSPLKQLLGDLAVETDCRIDRLAGAAGDWWLTDAAGRRHGPFTGVALAVPAPQAAALLASLGSAEPAALRDAAARAEMAPCWALLLAFDPPLALAGFDAAALAGGPIAWIARNTTKEGRRGRDAWTVHAAPDWSKAHLEAQPAEVAPLLRDAFFAATGTAPRQPSHLEAHRWRYALVTRPAGVEALFDPASGLGVCGDWCLGGKVEAAFLSGRALARQILQRTTD